MDKNQNIRINIAGRYYPLTIKMSDEEYVRKASQLINDKIQQYRKTYVGKDEQDYLAMATLQIIKDALQQQEKLNIIPVIEDIMEINSDIENYLQEAN